MRLDPPPENTEGVARVSHSVEHRIDWNWVAVAAAVIAVTWVVHKQLSPSESDDSDDVDESEAATIDVESIPSRGGGLGGNSEGTSGWMEEQLQ